MKRLVALVVLLGLVMVFSSVVAQDKDKDGEKQGKKEAKSRDFAVRMVSKPNRFDQKDIEIQVGDTVTWINASGAEHTATPDSDSPVKFTEVVVAAGKFSNKVTFPMAGTVKYHCERHPEMTGTITVR